MALWCFAKDVVEGAENAPHGIICQTIVNSPAIAFCLNEAIEAKPGCETEDCRKESSSSSSVTDFSPSQSRQRIMSRDSCESAFNNSLACFARFAIKAKLPAEDDGLLVFFAAGR